MQARDVDQITNIPVDSIFLDPTFNCRGSVAPIDVTELAQDIEKHGLQQPIVVRKLDSDKYDYQVVTGHRRLTAFKVLDKDTIPCFVNNNLSDTDALIVNLGENLHRQSLNIMQEAKAIERLKLEGFSMHDVAQALGKSGGWVKVRFQLLELPHPIQDAAGAGFISQKHIKELHAIPEFKKQIEAAKAIKEAKIRGDKVPAIAKKPKKRNILKSKIRDTEDVFWMQNHIQESIGNNFGTRCLAWVAGEINDHELFQDIERIAIDSELPYSIPYELGGIK